MCVCVCVCVCMCVCVCVCVEVILPRLYCAELEKSQHISIKLGTGIALFQGLSNLAINAVVLGVVSQGGYLLATNQLTAGELMSFLVATQTIQR